MKKSIKPCCKKFKELSRIYQDLSGDLDEGIHAIAMLLLSVDQTDLIDEKTLMEVGHTLEVYLNRKNVIEYFLFGRTLSGCTLDDIDISAELCRVSLRLKEAGWFNKT